jgi:hypothetical protein
MNRRTLLAALGLSLGSLAALTYQPAFARVAVPNVGGSYFGMFKSTAGNVWNAEFDLYQQVGSHLDGRLTIAALNRDMPLTGSCSSASAFTLAGSSGFGRNAVRFKLRGRCHVGTGGDDLTTFTGDYIVTGARQERGTFTLSGQRH